MNENKLVLMQGIYKSFENVHAVIDANFDLNQGEIHSVVGENGAGKSTLMKILYGIHKPDMGTIFVKNKMYHSLTPADAIKLNIGMVHQEFMLAKGVTVLENIILGNEPHKGQKINYSEAQRKISYYIDNYGLDIPLDKMTKDISIGEAQRTEIIKALYRGAQILILDEPTSVLTPQESEQLFKILEAMCKDGKSIVFISHKLNEVMQISNRITAMRQGKTLATVKTQDISIPELAKLMVGREVFLNIASSDHSSRSEVVLSVENIFVPGEKELSKIRNVSFAVYKGEILGVAGVDGNGQSELAEAIAGLRPVEKGKIVLNGVSIEKLPTLSRRKLGFAYIPEDRNSQGLNAGMTIKENLIGNVFYKPDFAKLGVLRENNIKLLAQKLVDRFDIRPPIIKANVSSLSGGNAQKVVIAREMNEDASLLLACQPTRGVDIGAIESIRKSILDAKRNGCSVLLISSDLEEILSLSDRILVMYEGKITGILDISEANEENLGLLMMGAPHV